MEHASSAKLDGKSVLDQANDGRTRDGGYAELMTALAVLFTICLIT